MKTITALLCGLIIGTASLGAASQGAPPVENLSGSQLTTYMGPTATEDAGYYRFMPDGTYTFLWNNAMASYGMNLNNGWLRNGRLCGLAVLNYGGLIMGYNYVEFDPATGQPLKEESVSPGNTIDMGTYYLSCAYVPEEDRVYGFTQTSDGAGFNFCSSPATKIGDVTVIANINDLSERANALCYNPIDGYFYGVTFAGDFVRISKKGERESIFSLELEGLKNDKAALVYSPYDGCFLYTPQYYYYATQLYYIYPEQKEMRFVRNFPTDNQFFFFIDEAFEYIAEAPAAPREVAVSIAPGALQGSLRLQLPSSNSDGSAPAGKLKWTCRLDNSIISSGEENPGAEVEIKLGPVENGEHVVRVSCSNEAGEGVPYVLRHYFGNGMPLAPAEVTLTTSKVSWTPVEEALFGGYLEPGKMRYEVYLNNRFIGSTDQTSMDISLDPAEPVEAYYAYVAASCNSQVSERSKSNKIVFGAPIDLPYTIIPTEEQAELTQVFNLDGSPEYGMWDFSPSRWHEPVFYSGWNQVQADDWLILPPVNCPDLSRAYRITLDAICGGMTGKDERFEVWCGDAAHPDAMNTLIIPETKVSEFITNGWETFSNKFVPKSAGPTYIAIRAVSPPEQVSLIVRKIIIEQTDEAADVPCAPGELQVLSADDATLKATISFRMPTHTIAGSEIPASAALKAHAGVQDKWSVRDAAPGETVTLTIDTYQGDNRIEVYCSIDGQAGQSANASVFTGTIPPNYVEKLTSLVSRDNMSVTLRWEQPLGGQENLEGYYSPEGMHYYLMEMVENEVYGDYEWVATTDLGNVNEYTYTLPDGAPMERKHLGIVAANAGGVSKALWYVDHLIGTPYHSVVDENFDGGANPALHYGPINIATPTKDYNGSWSVAYPEEVIPEAWDMDIPYALVAYTDDEYGGLTRLELPKFSTENVEDPALTLRLWTTEPCGSVSVYASTFGEVPFKLIYSVDSYDDGWREIVVPLPETYHNMPWIQLAIDVDLPDSYTYGLLGGYRFGPAETDSVQMLLQEDGVAIAGGKGAIYIAGINEDTLTDIRVFDTDGTLRAYHRAATATAEIRVAPGIYMVRCGDTVVRKVIVR